MRGSQDSPFFPVDYFGIIPAHAGLTHEEFHRSRSARDHPRACGAHDVKGLNIHDNVGSSPRMRGSLPFFIDINICLGIIPAHAGLTRMWLERRSTVRDHPRACGAHMGSSDRKVSSPGSSPRMRGSLDRKTNFRKFIGIIPAHAGLTLKGTSGRSRCWDHPRACGAHEHDAIGNHAIAGSSPRMRGSLKQGGTTFTQGGIIPAHAGLTTGQRAD